MFSLFFSHPLLGRYSDFCWGGRISSTLQGPSIWTKTPSDIREINRRISNLVGYLRGISIDVEVPRDSQAREVEVEIQRGERPLAEGERKYLGNKVLFYYVDIFFR